MQKNRPKIALFAYSEPGYACLKELLRQKANIALVVTHEDAPDENIWFHSVYDLARGNNIPACRGKKVDDAARKLFFALKPDIIISSYYRAIIPDEFLDKAKGGSFNLHGSLLPLYRGRAPINWAVLNGETKTGVTLHEMTSLADRGDIIDQIAFPIGEEATAHDVFFDVSRSVEELMARNLKRLEDGTYPHVPQDEARATKFGRRRPEDGRLDWQKSAKAAYDLVRAVTHPFPGAFCYADEKKLFIWRAAYQDDLPSPLKEAVPGTLCLKDGRFFVRCQKGALELLCVQEEEKAEIAPKDCPLLKPGLILK